MRRRLTLTLALALALTLTLTLGPYPSLLRTARAHLPCGGEVALRRADHLGEAHGRYERDMREMREI